jgi:uncharacterized protein (TIGR02246 family)
MRRHLLARLTALALCAAAPIPAQTALEPFGRAPQSAAAPSDQLTTLGPSPGVAFLFDLEAKFAKATAEGGGPAFAQWFAPDGTTLSNGKAPVVGRAAITAQATWSPKNYQLTWTPTGGQLAGDMGYTWGHYTGTSINPDGQRSSTTGRYITVWRKQPDGQWKVSLDASNDEPAGSGECCRLPK